jgi:GNAT superfamily N-acetyltransferase
LGLGCGIVNIIGCIAVRLGRSDLQEKLMTMAVLVLKCAGNDLGGVSLDNSLTHRLATRADLELLNAVMDAAISENQKGFLTQAQIAASRKFMGLDTQLVDDGTYFVIESGTQIVGCGGWSRRATLYGGNQTPGRDAALLDPAKDPARIRAMYTHPAHTRKGVGRLIIELSENAARAEGFKAAEMMATMSGKPLYEACGYTAVEVVSDDRGGVPVPLLRMRKGL